MAWSGPLFDGHVCSLGYEVIDWLHDLACHGPGDVQGQPLDWDDEIRDFVIEAYRLDPDTGKRIYREAVLSRPKGRAKSEIAGMLVVAEALGPVRFDGWDAGGQPVGRPVVSPLIKCLATEESQAGNTFENAAFVLGEWGPDAHPDVYGGNSGVRRYQSATSVYLPGGGEVRACTAGAASKDGGKETFVVPDESHLYVTRELREMYATVMRNLPKRRLAEPWALQTTTAYRPGEQSVAEETLTRWRKGQLPGSVLVDHRQAKGKVDIRDREHTLEQLVELYGEAMHPVRGWMDPGDTYEVMIDPQKCPDEATAARYYLNIPMSTKDAWIGADVVDRQGKDEDVDLGASIALGFDGSLNDDSTVLIGSRMSDGLLFPLGIWSKPDGPAGEFWEVPRKDVLARIRWVFGAYKVTRLYADPHEWRTDIDALAEEFGESRVVPWETRRDTQMAAALDRVHSDLVNGSLWWSTSMAHSKEFAEHFKNAFVRWRGKLRLVRKENEKSARKIDSVVGAALAAEARADALTAKEKSSLTRAKGRATTR